MPVVSVRATPVEIDFALFVTPVEGHMVARYGSRSYIGCIKKVVEPQTQAEREAIARKQPWARTTYELQWDADTIVPIPRAEAERYRKEYERALRDGALKEHERADWETQVKARKAKAKEVADRLAKAADAAEKTAG